MKKHAYDFGIIGNCAYIALIDSKATVKWLCWPQFDSNFIFGSLLDNDKGGQFSIAPDTDEFSTSQEYLENTNILCTDFVTPDSKFRVTDFAPRFRQYNRYYRPLMLIRKIEPIEGEPILKINCSPVVENGKRFASMTIGSNHIQFNGYPEELRLTTNVSLSYIRKGKSFILNEIKYFVLTYGIPLEANLEYNCEDFYRRTIQYWQNWVKSTYITDFYQEYIIRSALAIKLHQFEQTGAIIASPTTSLPEFPGSGRNWDYRYCWLRDSYYTLSAFNNIGHFEELEIYFQFIANITIHNKERLQPLYSIDGESNLPEHEIDFEGYLGNKPVRIGNAAYTQKQNDVYGQVLVSLLPLYIDRRFIGDTRIASMELVKNLLRMIDKTMDEEDSGLWEFRSSFGKHGYTYLFHWAGCNAAMKIFEQVGETAKMKNYAKKLRARAAARLESCFNKEIGAYAAAIGSSNLDASLLQMFTLGYLNPQSAKAKSHLRALEKNLMSNNGLFYRYKFNDGFGIPESTFLICSFWYVDALVLTGKLDKAIQLFEDLLQYTNPLGLLSEDVEASTGSQWGNFPQTYSHVGQINAAIRIVRKLDKPIFK